MAEISDDTMALIDKLVAGVMTKMSKGDIDGGFRAKAEAAMIIARGWAAGREIPWQAKKMSRHIAQLRQ